MILNIHHLKILELLFRKTIDRIPLQTVHLNLSYPRLACVRSLPRNLIKVIDQTSYKSRPNLNEKVWFESNLTSTILEMIHFTIYLLKETYHSINNKFQILDI